jgi:hypothetical protein
MWASQADRDRIVAILQQSFAEGRLTRPELGQRVGQALVAGEFPELVALIGDLPAGPFDRLPAHRARPCPAGARRAGSRGCAPGGGRAGSLGR